LSILATYAILAIAAAVVYILGGFVAIAVVIV
jgi:hypothetical protein